jgi:phosphoserine phosphatase
VAVDEPGTLWVCDFDGTLYRGKLARLAHGISNADLFLQVLLRSSGWAHAWRLLKGGWAIRRLHLSLLKLYRTGEMPLGEKDARGIQAFRQLLRAESNEWVIRSAGRALAGGLAPHASTTLARWLGPQDSVLILSKGLMPALLPVALQLSKELGRPVDVIGNRVEEDGGILRSADKERELDAFVAEHPCARAVVVGDTEEDIGMRDALVRHGVATRLVGIAPKDDRIRRAADVVYYTWKQASGHPFPA